MSDRDEALDAFTTIQQAKITRKALSEQLDQIALDRAVARLSFDRRDQAAMWLLDGLNAQTSEVWLEVSAQVARLLNDQERAGLLVAVVKAVPSDLAVQVIEGLFDPSFAFGMRAKDHITEAKTWALKASPPEVRAFIHEGINKMNVEGKRKLLEWLKNQVD